MCSSCDGREAPGRAPGFAMTEDPGLDHTSGRGMGCFADRSKPEQRIAVKTPNALLDKRLFELQ